ncbi:MAG: 3-hydroxybutyryl-CoA dehydrogenase [Ignavibacteriae bacterium]|nr:3-hydroxybutyryl-CoA dehydrogenase [Ignavibacteriota bacterium]
MMEKHIWILGDSPLVEEYTALFVQHEFETRVRINPEGAVSRVPLGARQFVESEQITSAVLELTALSQETKRKNLVLLDDIVPFHIPILSASVTATVAEQASWLKYPSRLIGIGAFPTLLDSGTIELVQSPTTGNPARVAAEQLVAMLEMHVALVEDSVGLVMPRILCSLINEACFALAEQLAEPEDIDTAMKLGTNYPCGPFEWAERIGAKHVLAVMKALHRFYEEDRYRSAPLLQMAALRNMSLRKMNG